VTGSAAFASCTRGRRTNSFCFRATVRFVAIIQSPFGACYRTDYCAAPRSRHDGNGGNAGTHSYLNGTAMLQVLQHHEENNKGSGGDVDIVKAMLNMNLKGLSSFRVASVDQTMQFGGASNLSVGDALPSVRLAISGTKANMLYKQRDSLLKHCHELKRIFPSLHEPSCFGAHLVKDTCQATICSMQEPLPRRGC
jgi:hypothetical protein